MASIRRELDPRHGWMTGTEESLWSAWPNRKEGRMDWPLESSIAILQDSGPVQDRKS